MGRHAPEGATREHWMGTAAHQFWNAEEAKARGDMDMVAFYRERMLEALRLADRAE